MSLASLCAALGVTGCAITQTAPQVSAPGAAIQGHVHGGQQPISGAHIYLLAANTTGYGGNGLAASTANASLSLLKNVSGTTALDSSGGATNGFYYVTTGNAGSFTISGDYTCTAGQQVYLYVLGGNPGLAAGTDNVAAGLLAILGSCPSTGNFAATIPDVFIDEISTVAAAYAFAGFASDALHVSSSGTALAQTGIANAFANAANLASLSSGQALTTTPAGNGTVPQSTINTIANILAACVNTAGSSSTGCSTLFSNIKSAGATGTAATDTATAAIYLAQNPYPGATQMTALYGNPTPATPFTPTLSTVPTDFTIGLSFTGGGLNQPQNIAIDGSGNVWVTNEGGNDLSEFNSSTGAALSRTTGYTGGGLDSMHGIAIAKPSYVWIGNIANNSLSEFNSAGNAGSGTSGFTGGGMYDPAAVAIDGSGNVWTANDNYSSLSKFNGSTGAAISTSGAYAGGGVDEPTAIAIDGSGNAWVSNYLNSLSKFNGSTGAAISSSSGYTGGGINYSTGIAIDASGNVWAANSGNLSKTNGSTGVAISGSSGYTGGGIGNPSALAIDGAGNVWADNSNTLSEFNGSTGAAISGSSGYTSGILSDSLGIAIDGSGNIWASNLANNTVTEIIGSATPVITPICAGLPSTPTADGTSNLGTRP